MKSTKKSSFREFLMIILIKLHSESAKAIGFIIFTAIIIPHGWSHARGVSEYIPSSWWDPIGVGLLIQIILHNSHELFFHSTAEYLLALRL